MFASGDVRDPTEISLESIKHDVEISYKFFQANYQRYHQFYDFVFRTALSSQDIEKLKDIGKPPIEANILEALISRLRGEFAKLKPTLNITPAEAMRLGKMTPQYQQLLKVLQGHLTEILFESGNDEFEYDMYSDCLGGGFGAAKVYPDYINDKSFLQKLNVERCFNPTMVGFDPLARTSHKGDGRYSFELNPMTKEEFAQEYGKDKAKEFYYTRAIQSFNWSYQNNEEKIVLIGDYYIKVPKHETLCLLADGQAVVERDYNQMVKNWSSIEQPPIILQRRKTLITTIERYRICENEILDHDKTSYPMLPLVFFDGNSVWIQNEQGGQMQQFCRPYIYNAKGSQQLKNFAMQSLGSELEDIVQNQFIAPIEAIPQDPQYREAFTRPQIAATLAYHQFDQSRPDVRLDPPQVLQRRPIPPTINEVFTGMDGTVQTVMGSYDGILGINGKEISGKAIMQGAMQSNAAAIPYLMGYIRGMQRVAEIIVHMIPQYYKTPRSIPIHLSNGKRDWVMINDEEDPEAVDFNYDPHDLNVKIEPGVSAEIQKQLAVEQLTNLGQTFEKFKMFMEDKGIPVILENIDIHGAEGLKESFEEWDAQMRQQPPKPSPVEVEAQTVLQIEQMKAQQRQAENEGNLAIQGAKVAVEKERAETERLEALAKLGLDVDRQMLEKEKLDAENTRSAIEAILDMTQQSSQGMNIGQ